MMSASKKKSGKKLFLELRENGNSTVNLLGHVKYYSPILLWKFKALSAYIKKSESELIVIVH